MQKQQIQKEGGDLAPHLDLGEGDRFGAQKQSCERGVGHGVPAPANRSGQKTPLVGTPFGMAGSWMGRIVRPDRVDGRPHHPTSLVQLIT